MKNKYFFTLFALLLVAAAISCRKNKEFTEAEKIVIEWTGKQIVFPDSVTCLSVGKDTTCILPESTPFKILVYTDSSGCTSCKLRLYMWNKLIEEAKAEMPELVNFQFYFQPKNLNELKVLFRRDAFTYPSYIDTKSELNRLNNLPTNDKFQTFLLDKDNKVVSIGNPTNNPQVWELYRKIIKGEEATQADAPIATTTVEIENTEMELKNLKLKQATTTTFTVKNTGDAPLLIKHVDASCGCTVPRWTKQPVLPNKSTDIEVQVTPDVEGYFRKVVNIYCNTEQQNIALTIFGVVENK